MTIAALYVQRGGVYYGLPDVDPWDEERDARLYAGPWPVVAHPPCARWCRLARLVEVAGGRAVGDDDGCFEAALASVRRWGGVLEHPAQSMAWRHFGLPEPPSSGGWVRDLFGGGWSCHVEQGHYGHRARKATWLYATVGTELPSLRWGPSKATMVVSTSRRVNGALPEMPKRERSRTPEPFRDLLLSIARSATPGGTRCAANASSSQR